MAYSQTQTQLPYLCLIILIQSVGLLWSRRTGSAEEEEDDEEIVDADNYVETIA
jgi:hypothetical protein